MQVVASGRLGPGGHALRGRDKDRDRSRGRLHTALAVAAIFAAAAAGALGCSAPGRGGDSDVNPGPGPGPGKSDMAQNLPPCVGLGCKIAQCPPTGSDTILAGRVTAPNGVDPIREAIVYVPSMGVPDEFPAEVACEVCNNPVGGRPVAQTLTDIDGNFELRRVPVTDATPIVIQKGRWRKVITVPVQKCERQALSEDETRLPRVKAEGNIPRMAMAVGQWDAIECVMRHIGIKDEEFTAPNGGGAVHLYNNRSDGIGAPGGAGISGLLSDLKKMLQYNLIFLNCSDDTYSSDLLRDPTVVKNLHDYVARGGRLYVTDWSYDFIGQVPEFAPYICFNDDKPCTYQKPHGRYSATDAFRTANFSSPLSAEIDQSTEAGRNLATWMSKLKKPSPGGRVAIYDDVGSWVMMRQTADDQMQYASTTWLSGTVSGMKRPLTVSFDYPAAPLSCGKVLYSSYHTREHEAAQAFPRYCAKGDMLAQEQVLEYLIFEISSCVGPIG
ncbi:MAG: hypothetical protein U1A78_22435 [Polyangia bacterium]